MLADHISVASSPWSDERSMVLHLILTTLAGEEIQLTIELQEYDRLQEFESAVLEQLPQIGESSTFGCELKFICRGSQQKLADPIWHTLRPKERKRTSFGHEPTSRADFEMSRIIGPVSLCLRRPDSCIPESTLDRTSNLPPTRSQIWPFQPSSRQITGRPTVHPPSDRDSSVAPL